MADFSNTDDVIYIGEVIARVEELREELSEMAEGKGDLGYTADGSTPDEGKEELAQLEALLEECKGNGGDEQWQGDWYPSTLIRESHFKDYAQELAEDIGAINEKAMWPNNCIDWGQAARELQQDYTVADFDGVTYYYR